MICNLFRLYYSLCPIVCVLWEAPADPYLTLDKMDGCN